VRITVALDSLVISFNKGALRSVLLPGASSQQAEDDVIKLSIDARMQRRAARCAWS
jgi:hypothetical protein